MPPTISVIIPCYNEKTTIRPLLEAIYGQTVACADMEVVIADGMSKDGTREEIASFAEAHSDLRIDVVDNQKRNIPAALNAALAEAGGEIIIRIDAHAWPYPDYIERCVADLQAGLGENVGGVWEIRPGAQTWAARSIAAAAAHPLGVGDAFYRHAAKPIYVDTVPFGAFKRELLALIGFFDETLLTNEDYEFNARIRKRGGKVWLDPAIRSVYYSRSTFAGLAKQYWRYGFWKYRMLRRYPQTLRWRQGLPPLFVLSLPVLVGAGFFWNFFWIMLGAELLAYTGVLLVAGMLSALKRREFGISIGLPLAVAIMHLTWGSGFLWSIIKGMTEINKVGKA